MRNFFLITLGKWVSNLSLTLNLGSGSTWPGHFALKQNRNFIKQLLKKSHTKIVLIAGTNGKTTTSTLITHMLTKQGKTVVQNTSGANLLSGIASTLLLNTNKQGTLAADYAVFEVDENALPPLLKQLTPNTLILLNLFRDQLDRYGEVNSIVDHWSTALTSLPKTTTLILNADDPEIAYIGLRHPEQSEGSHIDSLAKPHSDNVKYFGLDDKSLGQTTFQHASDSIYCPKCHTKLTYSTRFFSHLGIWKCESCKMKRPALAAIPPTTYPLSGIYNMYNTHAAVLFASLQGFDTDTIEKSLSGFTAAFGRQEVVTYYGKNVQLFLSKNPTSFNQSLRTIKELGGKYLLLALNDRAPDGTDVSWIWDTDMEEYLTPDMKIFITGDRCFDMGIRVKYALDTKNSNVYEHIEKAIEDAICTMPQDETLFILPTYSAMLEARKIITGRKIL